MKTIRQMAGHAITRATSGERAVSTETRDKFTEAAAALRAELGDDAVFEFCLGEIVRQMNAQTEQQEEAERAARSHFSKFLDYDDTPAGSAWDRKLYE